MFFGIFPASFEFSGGFSLKYPLALLFLDLSKGLLRSFKATSQSYTAKEGALNEDEADVFFFFLRGCLSCEVLVLFVFRIVRSVVVFFLRFFLKFSLN